MNAKRTIDPAIGARLRVERERHDLSVRQLAKAARVSPSLISKMETGKQRISAEYIRLFSKILRCRPSTFYKSSEAPSQQRLLSLTLKPAVGQKDAGS
jgi:transcriptional regulator with XRE-family HTH domain